jgi:endonuclease YncB( thermonuclease family)
MPAPRWKLRLQPSHPSKTSVALNRSRRHIFCVRLLAVWFVSLPVTRAVSASEPPCISGVPETVGTGTAIDARTLRLRDGREIRLAGLEPLQHDERALQAARRALDALLKDRDLALFTVTKPDRYGRLSAFVVPVGQSVSMQEHLLKSGDFAAGLVENDACIPQLQRFEAEARSARRGIWAGTNALKNTETTGDILAMMGQFIVAEGKVLSARQAGATFYINFGRRWTRDFALTIARRDISAFEKAGVSRLTLEGQTVRVRGWVTDQRGSPRIQVTKPAQIEIVKQ